MVEHGKLAESPTFHAVTCWGPEAAVEGCWVSSADERRVVASDFREGPPRGADSSAFQAAAAQLPAATYGRAPPTCFAC